MDASDTSFNTVTVKPEPAPTPLPFRVRSVIEGGREIMKLLSDSDGEDPLDPKVQKPKAGADEYPADGFGTLWLDRSSPQSYSAAFGAQNHDTESSSGSSRTATPITDCLSSQAGAGGDGLQPSDTVWLDDYVSSTFNQSFTSDARTFVERFEYFTEIPSVMRADAPTSFLIAQTPNSNFSMRMDNDCWRGPSGAGDPPVDVIFSPGEPPISCRRKRNDCKGCHHPVSPPFKMSAVTKSKYSQCVQAVGLLGPPWRSSAASTRLLLDGQKHSQYTPALQNKRIKQDLIAREKKKYPAGLGVIFYDALERGVTLPRAYINRADTAFFERLFDVFREIKTGATGKDIRRRARAILKTNVPSFSGITTLDQQLFATSFVKFCAGHAQRPIPDFKRLVSSDEYIRIKDFRYIDSPEALASSANSLPVLVHVPRKSEEMNDWIIPKSQSNILPEHFYVGPRTPPEPPRKEELSPRGDAKSPRKDEGESFPRLGAFEKRLEVSGSPSQVRFRLGESEL
ncbi:hypothetical protein C8R47DRAFT_1084604 [Mycena vitilis]|nr:hypothetical protein C8R47DRAFT_1084604 [Mycena vitilis]